MKHLYETIFDTTANPEDFVVWKRTSFNGPSFSADADDAWPAIQLLLDPILLKSKETDMETCKKARSEHNPFMVVGDLEHFHVRIYCKESGRWFMYSLFRAHGGETFDVGRYPVEPRDMSPYFKKSDQSFYQYYLISKKDLKIIQDLYSSIQKRTKKTLHEK